MTGRLLPSGGHHVLRCKHERQHADHPNRVFEPTNVSAAGGGSPNVAQMPYACVLVCPAHTPTHSSLCIWQRVPVQFGRDVCNELSRHRTGHMRRGQCRVRGRATGRLDTLFNTCFINRYGSCCIGAAEMATNPRASPITHPGGWIPWRDGLRR